MAAIALKFTSTDVTVVDITKSRIVAWYNDQIPIYQPVNTTTKTSGLGVGKAGDLTYWDSAA
ncbi:UDP-glucose 6-dehydrogenase [Medicago truncatula]|uniref:UDP-glucose 6-dehydrogenase n=1 Tax=Medicago truncatula TaxID=3880 RepID=A0A072U6P2_MEDTR|nr:UDP-glucose 6-dehydrogenase [Medicago truncatula]